MAESGTCTFHLVIMEDKGKFFKKINVFSPEKCFQREEVTTAFCHRANAGFLH